jgi:N-acetylneuraminic acid mutarotase
MMKNSKINIPILFFVLFLLSCQKEAELKTKTYSYVIINEPIVENGSAEFSATVTYFGTDDIINYGFKWAEKNNHEKSDSILFEGTPVQKDFTYLLANGLYFGREYSVKAILVTQRNKVYSQNITFKSLGSKPPIIDDFSPKEGGIGRQIEITGKDFPPFVKENVIKMGEYIATITSASENKLIVTVPNAIRESKNVVITLESQGRSIVAKDSFYLKYPWKKLKDFPGNIMTNPNCLSIGNNGYVFLGWNNHGPSSEVWEYNPIKDTWTIKAEFPGALRTGPVSFVANNKAYIGLGCGRLSGTDLLNDMWEFDPIFNNWNEFAFCQIPGRENATCFCINNEVYLGLGYYYAYDTWSDNVGERYYNDWVNFNVDNLNWVLQQKFPSNSRYNSISFTIDQNGYVGGGLAYDYNLNDYSNFRDFYKYNPLENNWERIADFPENCSKCIGFTINNKAYVGFDSYWEYSSNKFYEYSPTLNQWKEMQLWPLDEKPSVAFSIGEKGYIGLGSTNTFYEFDPSKN